MLGTITPGEEAQLAQTIEVFEEITKSQPHDYQSLEILKEAYVKLGRDEDALRTSKRIATAHRQTGQISSAILEFESILQRCPGDVEVLAALAEIESKAGGLASQPLPAASAPSSRASGTPRSFTPKASATRSASRIAPTEFDDGRDAMSKLFVESKVITSALFQECWPPPDWSVAPEEPVTPFVQILADKSILPVERSLRLLSDKTRLGYLQLDRYDVDSDLTRGFSAETCRRWCVLPFDRLSKTMLVATANPFNRQAAEELQEHNKLRLLWYLASPAELSRWLRKIFR
jgi:hypothetical protein